MHLTRATATTAVAMLMAVVIPHAADALLIGRADDFSIPLFNPTANNFKSRALRVLFNVKLIALLSALPKQLVQVSERVL